MAYLSRRDQAVQRQRETEAARSSLVAFTQEMGVLEVAATRDDWAAGRRRRAEAEALEHEEMMEKMTRTAMLEARRKARAAEQEEALALEIARKRREEESAQLEIARICEADPSLRDLQQKLKMAYVTKERVGQVREKELRAAAAVEEQAALDRAAAEALAREHEKEAARQAERRMASVASKEQLQRDLHEKEMRAFLEAEKEAAREREMVDAILAKIRAEDEAEAAVRARARDETIHVIEVFKEQRERALTAQRAAEREEEARIAQYMVAQAARDEEVKRAKAEDAAVREAKYRAIVAEQEALRKKQEEEDALRWLLVEEEAEKRRVEAERKRIADAERSKRDMLSANEEQRRIRDRIAVEEARKEAALIEQFLAKCAEDDKKEAMARRAKDEARARYMVEIQQQRDERVALYQAQKLEEYRAVEEAQRKDEFRRRVVQEARRRMLEEHAAVLRGYLPRGVVLSNEDLQIIKAFDSNKDGRLDAEELELAAAAFRALDPVGRSAAAAEASAASVTPAPAASTRAAPPAAAAPVPASRSTGTAGLLPGRGGAFYGTRGKE